MSEGGATLGRGLGGEVSLLPPFPLCFPIPRRSALTSLAEGDPRFLGFFKIQVSHRKASHSKLRMRGRWGKAWLPKRWQNITRRGRHFHPHF